MNTKSLKYLISEGFRSLWTNRMMSIASVAVLMSCLLLIGTAVMMFVNINELMSKIEGQNVIMVFLEDATNKEEVDAIQKEIKNMANIKDCEFVPKEDAWQQQLDSMEDAQKQFFVENGDGNILPDAFKVKVNDMNEFDKTVKSLKNIEKVETIRENKDLAQKLVSIRQGISVVAIGIIAILFAVSMFIISNTIKLTMYSRRLEINIMKSVGATDAFVKIPFVVEGIVLGVLSGVISLLMVWGVYEFAISQFGVLLSSFGMVAVKFIKYLFPMLGAFVLIGVLSGALGSVISMRKYLKKEGSEISAL